MSCSSRRAETQAAAAAGAGKAGGIGFKITEQGGAKGAGTHGFPGVYGLHTLQNLSRGRRRAASKR